MKKNTGRSFLGTLFLVAIGFVAGVYQTEILAYGQNIVQRLF